MMFPVIPWHMVILHHKAGVEERMVGKYGERVAGPKKTAVPPIVANSIYKNYLLLYIMSYYVPDGNWTNNVVSSLGNNAVDVLNYVPNVDSIADPAVGCAKNFTSTYKCGLGTTAKSVSVDAEAGGKSTFSLTTISSRR